MNRALERMVGDQLPGGKFADITDALREETSSVIPHNKKPEFVFSALDRLVKIRPNATTLTNEARTKRSNKNDQLQGHVVRSLWVFRAVHMVPYLVLLKHHNWFLTDLH